MGDYFGQELRITRNAAGFVTIARFADVLSEHGLAYSDEAIGHWERGVRTPDRATLLIVCAVLAAHNAIVTIDRANQLLELAGYNRLTLAEQRQYVPNAHAIIDNLPRKDHIQLIGRDDALTSLSRIFTSQAAPPVVTISGLGGIGKTALAHELVFRLMIHENFTQLLWESAKSEELTGTAVRPVETQIVSLYSIFQSYARQLGISNPPAEYDKLRAMLRAYLRREQCLLVIDNLESLQSARDVARELHHLISPDYRSRLLITSRERLVDEHYIFDYFLRGLTQEAALDLITVEAQARGAESLLQASQPLLRRIYRVTQGMPLALKLIVSQYQAGIALDEELDRLEHASDEEALYQFIYYTLWHKLSIPAQMVLVGAAALDMATDYDDLLATSEVTEAEFKMAQRELTLASLLDVHHHPEQAKQRYAIHAITRWFVNSTIVSLWEQQRYNNNTD